MSFDKRLLYDKLPEFSKDILGWGLRRFPRFQWKSTHEEEIYNAELKESEYASAEDLQAIQREKLHRLLEHCYKHVPYYRMVFADRCLKPDDFQTVADLKKLPILTKETVRANLDDLISDTARGKPNLKVFTTGGSTGTPGRFPFDGHMIGVRRAHWWRWSQFAGIDLYHDRMIFCGGAPLTWIYPPEDYRGFVNYQRTMLILSSAAMSDLVIDRYINDMLSFRGDYIRGYASGVFMLARRLVERRLSIPLKAVLTSSDMLVPSYREVIEIAFRCKVFDHYGQVEDALTATECGVEDGFHINVESCIAEIVDAEGVQVHGDEGRLVATHLENYVTPLVRYELNDIGILDHSWTKCTCGRSHQKILSVSGREEEFIVTSEGRRIACGAMSYPAKTMHESIKRCQYIQESLDTLRVKVVPTSTWEDVVHRKEFERNIRHQVGDVITIQIETTDSIPTRPNGKYQFIISKLEKK